MALYQNHNKTAFKAVLLGKYLYHNIHLDYMAVPKFKTLHVSLSEEEYFDMLALKAKYHAKTWVELFKKVRFAHDLR